MTNNLTRHTPPFRLYSEALIWVSVLVVLALSPAGEEGHLNLCLFNLAGFTWCPGCGIGRSMIRLLHGNLSASLSMHPLGIVAVILMMERTAEVFMKADQYWKVTAWPSDADSTVCPSVR